MRCAPQLSRLVVASSLEPVQCHAEDRRGCEVTVPLIKCINRLSRAIDAHFPGLETGGGRIGSGRAALVYRRGASKEAAGHLAPGYSQGAGHGPRRHTTAEPRDTFQDHSQR